MSRHFWKWKNCVAAIVQRLVPVLNLHGFLIVSDYRLRRYPVFVLVFVTCRITSLSFYSLMDSVCSAKNMDNGIFFTEIGDLY